jgi:Family of unknown function (DUF5335)
MNTQRAKKTDLTNFLKYYSEQNYGRPTRIGVFDNGNDYWLEDGMPLSGIDFDPRRKSLEILLGNELTHTINDATNVKINFNLVVENDGLDVTDAEGKVTVLRFENYE